MAAEEKIVEYPENWDEMVKKYQEREEEQLQKLRERWNVSSEEELLAVAKKAISSRSTRAAAEYVALKDHTIIQWEKSKEIQALRGQLAEEISAIVKSILEHFPAFRKSESLRGRVTLKIPEEVGT